MNPRLGTIATKSFQETAYELRCAACGAVYPEGEHRMACERSHGPSLLRTVYRAPRLKPRGSPSGVLRFGDWLPLRGPVEHRGDVAVYQSGKLAAALGIDRLWISFAGYWPERGATLMTTTFKELEAPAVCSRLAGDARTLVVASAGNTARAFAEVCSRNGLPLVLVAPEVALDAVWSVEPIGSSVELVVIGGGADYFDAIRVSDMIARLPGYVPEGGTRNIARRDGLGTVVLGAAIAIGELPAHYFQAVGSGAGGIAAWEASERLAADGRFGRGPMRLHLVQNAPFAPMVEAWAERARDIPALEEAEAIRRIERISAPVLSNRKPPYAIAGGVRDALSATDGRMYGVTNEDAAAAARLFAETEGIDLDPAAAVATAGLIQAARSGADLSGGPVLLNVTGGGRQRLFSERRLHRLAPSIVLAKSEATEARIAELFS